jgi:hypothetical protein
VTSDERFLRAELLRALGRDDGALRVYASFPDPQGYDLHYLALSHLGRVRIHDARGDRESRRPLPPVAYTASPPVTRCQTCSG